MKRFKRYLEEETVVASETLKSHNQSRQADWKWELTGCQDEWVGEARVEMKRVEIFGRFRGRKLLNNSSVCNSGAAEMLKGRRIVVGWALKNCFRSSNI